MPRPIFPVLVGLLTLVACADASGPAGAVMIPDKDYMLTHSAGYQMQLRFKQDGQVQEWRDGSYVDAGQIWFRRNGMLCVHGQYFGPDSATCSKERPSGNGGFDLVQEDATIKFRRVNN